jgi:hypothetical protein
MALRQQGIVIPQARLARLMDITDYGAPLSRILRLAQWNIPVTLQTGDDTAIKAWIDVQRAVIAFVATGQLPYWDFNVQHALLIVGYDETEVFINDPAFVDAPQRSPWGDFLLAWDELDSTYAVLSR